MNDKKIMKMIYDSIILDNGKERLLVYTMDGYFMLGLENSEDTFSFTKENVGDIIKALELITKDKE